MPSRSRRFRPWVAAVAVTLAVTAVVAAGVSTGSLGRLGRILADTQFPTGPTDDRLAVVELPLQATDWDRSEHARLIEALAAAGPVVIAYDVVFDADRPGEEALATAVRDAGNVILAASVPVRRDPGRDVLQAATVEGPRPQLAEAAAAVAHINVLADPLDRVVRRIPLVVEDGRQLIPALSLAAVAAVEGVDPSTVVLRAGTDVQVGGKLVPTGEDRLLELNWTDQLVSPAGQRAPTDDALIVSADDVLAGDERLAGRVVFVGVVDPLEDQVRSPVSGSLPGVYAHVNAANTMLTDLYRTGPDGPRTIVAAAVLAGLVAIAGVSLRLVWLPAVVVTLFLAWQAAVNLRFQTGETLDNLWPNVALVLAAVGIVAARYLGELREKRRVAALFTEYVPTAVARELIGSDRIDEMRAGERVEVTVLFCDLRGFTATAGRLQPAAVRELLEVYYDHATRVIFDHGGTVMQFVGDEVFAVFGAPVPQDDHAARALTAARDLQAAAASMNEALAGSGASVAFGIGCNSGDVVAAHVGSRVHRQYAVVGTTVNVGARLCSLARAGEIVISAATRDRLATVPPLEPLGPVALKGVEEDPQPHRLA